jgi:hypothetical protein
MHAIFKQGRTHLVYLIYLNKISSLSRKTALHNFTELNFLPECKLVVCLFVSKACFLHNLFQHLGFYMGMHFTGFCSYVIINYKKSSPHIRLQTF